MPNAHFNQDPGSTTLWLPESSNWEDLRFPAAAINPPGGVSDPDVDTTDGTLLFDKGSTEIIMGQAQMPHSTKRNSVLKPHIHWSPTDADTGDVLWRLEYQLAAINGSFPGAWTALDVLDTGAGDDKHQLAAFADIQLPDAGVSLMIKWRVSRIGGDASDDYDADAKLLEFDIHYQIDSVGSGELYTK